jgi:hypothetical protein
MSVGDYIICNYAAASGVIGVCSEIGASTAAEIPLIGAAAPNGTFYFIKAAEGILISDRVVQTNISWNALNTGKYIQGSPQTLGGMAATIRSLAGGVAYVNANSVISVAHSTYVSAVGTVSASSEWGVGFEAWRAVNFTRYPTAGYWSAAANIKVGWLKYQFTNARKIIAYAISTLAAPEGITRSPQAWTLEGSNDDSNWSVLDTHVGVTWTSGETKTYSIVNNTAYAYYRINVTANNGGSELNFDEVKLYENTDAIASASDLGMGIFPANNEWDKYIVNFPAGKIQAGKILDDVFHHVQTLCTWTQDTPILARADVSSRIGRGRITGLASTTAASTYSGVDYGFRPVLEY